MSEIKKITIYIIIMSRMTPYSKKLALKFKRFKIEMKKDPFNFKTAEDYAIKFIEQELDEILEENKTLKKKVRMQMNQVVAKLQEIDEKRKLNDEKSGGYWVDDNEEDNNI